MKRQPVLVFVTLLILLSALPVSGQWTVQQANDWYAAQSWLVGCNFLPSTAVNDIEMWQAESFVAATIDRELGWAQELGFNSVRVFLNFVVWRDDANELKQRLGEFLRIADRHGIRVMPVLFDDCNFAGRVAATGRQPDPVSGVHNSQWVSSPPLAMVSDKAAWPELEKYVKDMVGAFGNDKRVVLWDLYNEPGNSGMGAGNETGTAVDRRCVGEFQKPDVTAHDGAFGCRLVSRVRQPCWHRGEAETLHGVQPPGDLHGVVAAADGQHVCGAAATVP